MGDYGVSLRVWAVLLCLQVAAVCVDAGAFGVGDGAAHNQSKEVQHAGERLLDILFGDDDEDDASDSQLMARGKKKKKKLKYLVAVLIGVVIVKGIFIPLALKAVSLVAGKAFLMSALSLVLSAIIGFKRFAQSGWDRMGQMMAMRDHGEVTDIPYHPVPTEAMYQKVSTDHYWGRDFRNK